MLGSDTDAVNDWFITGSSYPMITHGAFSPPHLYAMTDTATDDPRGADAYDPAATQPLPSLALIQLRFPAELVQHRANAYAQQARLRGATHSLRLWKASYEETLAALVWASGAVAARQAGASPQKQQRWELLSWQRDGDWYLVSATFKDAPAMYHTVAH